MPPDPLGTLKIEAIVRELALVDILVGSAVGIGIILGLVRGFLLQFAGLGGLIGGFFLADRYHAELGEAIRRVWDIGHANTIAFILIAVVSFLIVMLICALCRRAVGKFRMGSYDRLLGGVFGGLKAALLSAGILFAILALAPQDGGIRRAARASWFGPVLWTGVDQAASVLPVETRTQIRQFLYVHDLRPSAHETPAEPALSSPSVDDDSAPLRLEDDRHQPHPREEPGDHEIAPLDVR